MRCATFWSRCGVSNPCRTASRAYVEIDAHEAWAATMSQAKIAPSWMPTFAKDSQRGWRSLGHWELSAAPPTVHAKIAPRWRTAFRTDSTPAPSTRSTECHPQFGRPNQTRLPDVFRRSRSRLPPMPSNCRTTGASCPRLRLRAIGSGSASLYCTTCPQRFPLRASLLKFPQAITQYVNAERTPAR